MQPASGSRFWDPLGAGAALSLLSASIGTIEDLSSRPEAYERFGYFLTAYAVAAAYLMAAFLALWAFAAVVSLILRGWSAALTLAGFISLCVYTVLMPSSGSYPLPLPWVERGPTLALILGCCILAAALLAAFRRWSGSGVWRKTLLVAAPAAMATLALAVGQWPFVYGGSSTAWLFAGVAILLLLASLRPAAAWRNKIALGSLALLFPAGAGNWHFERSFAPAARIGAGDADAPNVILITIDTLRFDSVFGKPDQRPATPTLDALAAKSYVFENAFSSGPWTPPGISSVMTGVGPLTHGIGLKGSSLPKEVPTIADRMAEAGYEVAACGLNVFVQQTGLLDRFPWSHWHPYWPFGLSIGNRILTTQVDYYLHEPPSTKLTGWAMDWLSQYGDTRFFFWLHYYDPHIPYNPPAELVDRELETPKIGAFLDWDDAERVRAGNPPMDADDRRWIRHLYDAEVRHIDAELGRLFARLEELELFDESLIVVTSDHGEEFFDHGGYEHGQSLYNELIHVPLIVKPPGGVEARRIEKFVATAAVTPTTLELAGVEADPADFSYPSLLPLLEDDEEAESHTVLSTGVHFFENWFSVVFDDRYKYIRRHVTGAEELYDLAADPRELSPLDDPATLERGRQLLRERIEIGEALRDRYGVSLGEEEDLNENTRRLLQSLGYVQ